MNYITNQVLKQLDQTYESKVVSYHELDNNLVRISYEYGGKTYYIVVPYDKELCRSGRRKQVFLQQGENFIDITQKPGIPYLLTPEQLGGKVLIKKDRKLLKDFNGSGQISL